MDESLGPSRQPHRLIEGECHGGAQWTPATSRSSSHRATVMSSTGQVGHSPSLQPRADEEGGHTRSGKP